MGCVLLSATAIHVKLLLRVLTRPYSSQCPHSVSLAQCVQHTHIQWVTRPVGIKEQLLPRRAGGVGDVACGTGSQLKCCLATGPADGLILSVNEAVVSVPEGWTDCVKDRTCKQARFERVCTLSADAMPSSTVRAKMAPSFKP
jgi:hypothetical protein